MTVKLHVLRYGGLYIIEFATVEEAAGVGSGLIENNQSMPVKLEDESGVVWEFEGIQTFDALRALAPAT